jgi:hypothetical protein
MGPHHTHSPRLGTPPHITTGHHHSPTISFFLVPSPNIVNMPSFFYLVTKTNPKLKTKQNKRCPSISYATTKQAHDAPTPPHVLIPFLIYFLFLSSSNDLLHLLYHGILCALHQNPQTQGYILIYVFLGTILPPHPT